MRRKGVIISSVAIIPCFGLFFWNSQQPGGDPVVGVIERQPTHEAILTSVKQAQPSYTGETLEQAKQRVFGEVFKNHYRQANPSTAIGVRFVGEKIRLFIPARMEPWVSDRFAHKLWHNAQSVLGKKYRIEICETYIGLAPVKIGELTYTEGTPDTLRIAYTFSKQHFGRITIP